MGVRTPTALDDLFRTSRGIAIKGSIRWQKVEQCVCVCVFVYVCSCF